MKPRIPPGSAGCLYKRRPAVADLLDDLEFRLQKLGLEREEFRMVIGQKYTNPVHGFLPAKHSTERQPRHHPSGVFAERGRHRT
jgi:hypothetical protein